MADFRAIMAELGSFSEEMLKKPMVVVATKMDAAGDPERLNGLRAEAEANGMEFFTISSVTGQGLSELKFALFERVKAAEPIPTLESGSAFRPWE